MEEFGVGLVLCCGFPHMRDTGRGSPRTCSYELCSYINMYTRLYSKGYITVGNLRTSKWPHDAFAHVPPTADSVTARPCRLDGTLPTRRLQGPIQTACKTRNALERGRYMRITLLVNLRSVSPTNGKEHDIERRTRP